MTRVAVAIALAAGTFALALALEACELPRPPVCAPALPLRLLPHAMLMEELRQCSEASGNTSLRSFTER